MLEKIRKNKKNGAFLYDIILSADRYYEEDKS